MLRLLYLYRNLTRNMLRTVLTCAAVALPIMIYVLSAAVIDGLDRFLENSAKQLRLVVTHKASIINPLPAGYRAKIESLDPTHGRIASVCGMRWIGGKVENVSTPLSTLAAQHDTFAATFPDENLSPDELEAWNRDRRAIIVGAATARQFGWKKGDRITIHPSVPPYTPMEFNVVSTAPNAKDPVTNFFRLDYLEEELKKIVVPVGWTADGWVSFIFVKCATKADLDHFRMAIDDLFAHSPDETKTQDEKAFMNDFINQIFNLPRNLRILAGVTIFVAVMAAANTMSMNIRDRMNEVATLKSLGFGRSFVIGLIQTESLTLCALGGAIGAAIPYVAFTHTPLRNYTVPLIQTLDVRPVVCGESLLIAAAIGVLAAAWPAWSAARLHVVEALRNLE
ncbi:MAG: ABC transporter permease [Phycisphaerales bacterium]|nr:ABC transporter permease [Phycisphaerales bacterium]